MIIVTFSAITQFELDLKIPVIIFRVDFEKFEIDREISEFSLMMIFQILVLKWLRLETEIFWDFTLN